MTSIQDLDRCTECVYLGPEALVPIKFPSETEIEKSMSDYFKTSRESGASRKRDLEKITKLAASRFANQSFTISAVKLNTLHVIYALEEDLAKSGDEDKTSNPRMCYGIARNALIHCAESYAKLHPETECNIRKSNPFCGV